MSTTSSKTTPSAASAASQAIAPVGRNEIVIAGRLAAEAEERELPSGDLIVTLRVVVPRTGGPRRAAKRTTSERPTSDGTVGSVRTGRTPTVDTIDVVCWTARSRRSALAARAGDQIEVTGALRRRFYGGPAGRQSRYEVEAARVRRATGAALSGT